MSQWVSLDPRRWAYLKHGLDCVACSGWSIPFRVSKVRCAVIGQPSLFQYKDHGPSRAAAEMTASVCECAWITQHEVLIIRGRLSHGSGPRS